MGIRESFKSEYETQGFLYIGAFKLDHLQPVKLIVSHKFSTCFPFILGGLLSYCPRERGRKEAEAENGIRESPKSE